MDYKIKLGHINLNVPGEVSVELKDIELEVTNLKLKDIGSIIKEAKNIIKEMHDLEKMNHEAQKERDEREYQHFMNAIAVQESHFPSHLTPPYGSVEDMDEEFGFVGAVPETELGLDTDGDLPKAQAKEPISGPPALYMEQQVAEEEIDAPKTGKVAKGRNKASRITFNKPQGSFAE